MAAPLPGPQSSPRTPGIGASAASARTPRRAAGLLLLGATLLLALSCGRSCGGSRERSGTPPRAALSVAGALSGDSSGFARADGPLKLELPEDYGPHPRFRTEWWYVTGNLDGPDGERFGYQLTFFRNALAPPPTPHGVDPVDDPAGPAGGETSRWATRQAWLAHFALTDASGHRFLADQRLARGGPIGLAGAASTSDGLRAWVDDWSMEPAAPSDSPGVPDPRFAAGLLPLHLRAAQPGAAIDLTLRPGKPLVLQGDHGLSIKGRDAATGTINASYYYSFTRLPTAGTVTLGDRAFRVTGSSWLDREWSTSALTGEQVGWDWFALQLDDGRDLMVYLLRRSEQAGGGVDPASSGTLVAPDGTPRHLVRSDLSVDVLDHWTSPVTGMTYPSGWRLRVPGAGLDVTIRPILDDQELDVGFRYWEGAVDVHGSHDGAPVAGRGYVELTGYGPQTAATAGRVR